MTLRRGWAALAAGLLLALTSVVPATGAGASGRARRPGSQSPTPAAPTMRVRSQTTWVPRNTAFTLTLDVTGAPAGATATTTVYEATSSHAAFDDSLAADHLEGALPLDLPPAPVDLAPSSGDGGRLVTVSILVRDGGDAAPGSVDINQFGVYPVEVLLHGPGGTTLARLVTHLVRLPDPGQDAEPLVTGLVVPFGSAPVLQPDGGNRLADADRRRLSATADSLLLHPSVPVSLAVTAETLDGLRATGDPTDATTLDRLTTAARDDQLLAQPYVDLDPSAWLASGLGPELASQQLIGAKVVGERLGHLPTPATQLTPRTVTPALATRLAGGGTQHLVGTADTFAPSDENLDALTTRPFLVGSGAVGFTAMQIDPRLQAAFVRHPDDPVLGAHELLAELASVFGDDPSGARGIVLVPPPGFAATVGFLETLLAGLQDANGVLAPTTLDGLFGLVPPAGGGSRTAGASDAGPARAFDPRPVAGLGSYPSRLRTTEGLLSTLQSLIGTGPKLIANLNRQLLVSGSTGLTPARRQQRLDIINTISSQQLGKIEVPDNQTVTLASSTADIPLAIRNQLDEPVTLRIELQANKRLEFPGGRSFLTKPLPPNATTRISIRVETRGSGVSPVQITVRAPDGRVLQSTRYRVQSTAVSGVGLIITIGAAAFLVLWWGRHVYRVRRERRGDRSPAHRRGRRSTAPG